MTKTASVSFSSGSSGELFQRCLAGSLAAHALLALAIGRGHVPGSASSNSAVEVDLTHLGGGGPAKRAAPKALSRVPGPLGPAQLSAPIAAPAAATPVAGPSAQALLGHMAAPLAAPGGTPDGTQLAAVPGGSPVGLAGPATAGGAAGGTGFSPLPGGTGRGAAYGSPEGIGDGGADLENGPKLLNRDEVLKNLRRFYPESERRAGREGKVLVFLHIGIDGAVSGVDVALSGGDAFDDAARSVGRLMRFSPAHARGGAPIAVKIRQAIQFRLED